MNHSNSDRIGYCPSSLFTEGHVSTIRIIFFLIGLDLKIVITLFWHYVRDFFIKLTKCKEVLSAFQ